MKRATNWPAEIEAIRQSRGGGALPKKTALNEKLRQSRKTSTRGGACRAVAFAGRRKFAALGRTADVPETQLKEAAAAARLGLKGKRPRPPSALPLRLEQKRLPPNGGCRENAVSAETAKRDTAERRTRRHRKRRL